MEVVRYDRRWTLASNLGSDRWSFHPRTTNPRVRSTARNWAGNPRRGAANQLPIAEQRFHSHLQTGGNPRGTEIAETFLDLMRKVDAQRAERQAAAS